MKIIVAIVILSAIIIIHELGHFLLAKKNGVYVTEFSVGMGPRLVSAVIGETRYSIKLLPFGGSCMMLGEDEESSNERAFGQQSIGARISIIAAGPIFNFILAFLAAIFVVSRSGYDPAIISDVEQGSAAQEAGLQAGDLITKIDNEKIQISRQYYVHFEFDKLSEEPVTVSYTRDNEAYTTTLVPKYKDNYMLGFSYNPNEEEVKILTLYEDYPLHEAGLELGDVITKVNGTEIKTGSDLATYTKENPLSEEPLEVTYLRDGSYTTVQVTPKLSSSGYTTGMSVNSYYTKVKPLQIFKYSWIEVKYMIKTTLQRLGQLITGKIGTDQLAGPVGVVNVIGSTYEQAKEYGLESILVNMANWIIIISANLGVMNLLPIPALDGGRLVFLFIEILRGGKTIPKEKEGIINLVGMAALMILMVYVMYNDITRLF